MVDRPPRSTTVKFVPVTPVALARYVAEELEHEQLLHQAWRDAAGDLEAALHRPGATAQEVAAATVTVEAARAEWLCALEHLRYLGADTGHLEDEERTR